MSRRSHRHSDVRTWVVRSVEYQEKVLLNRFVCLGERSNNNKKSYEITTARNPKQLNKYSWHESGLKLRRLLQKVLFKELFCTASKARWYYLLSPSVFKVTGPFMLSCVLANLQQRKNINPSLTGFFLFSWWKVCKGCMFLMAASGKTVHTIA